MSRSAKQRNGNHSKKKEEKPDEGPDPVNLLRKLTIANKRSRMSLDDVDVMPGGGGSLLAKKSPSVEQDQGVMHNGQARQSLTVDDHNSPGMALTATPSSTCMTSSTCMPEWYEDLTDDHSSAFKELFDMLDSANTGTLNADNLYEGLKRVDSEITKEEVENVLKKLDKDGNGEIDFDEFLFHMTQGDVFDLLDEESQETETKRKKKYSRRQRLFYTAITQFSLKNTLGDIERTYLARMRQAPHVLSHYTAGVRLIGLTDRQLARQMKRMQKSARHHDSPYAKPLPFVSQKGSVKTITRQGLHGGVRTYSKYRLTTSRTQIKPPRINDPKALRLSPFVEDKKGDALLSDDEMENNIKESINLWKRGSVVAKLPGAELVAKMKTKNVNKLHMGKEKAGDGSSPVMIHVEEDENDPCMYNLHKESAKSNWRIPKVPKVEHDEVALPVLKIKYLKRRPTIDDLPNIREKATQAINDYYQNMRKATVRNAFEHWEKLYADTIRPKKLLENFRIVYRAYSPHKEEEAFVVCPWIPGPYRHFRQTKSGNRNGRSPECGHSNVPQRPFSVH